LLLNDGAGLPTTNLYGISAQGAPAATAGCETPPTPRCVCRVIGASLRAAAAAEHDTIQWTTSG